MISASAGRSAIDRARRAIDLRILADVVRLRYIIHELFSFKKVYIRVSFLPNSHVPFSHVTHIEVLTMMGSIASATNPTLKGHKLLLTQTYPLPQQWLNKIKETYPQLEVVYQHLKSLWDHDFDLEIYKDVTCLCTYLVMPTRQQAPKLQYIQLSSAGANHIIGTPLYEDSTITVCTSNGIHP